MNTGGQVRHGKRVRAAVALATAGVVGITGCSGGRKKAPQRPLTMVDVGTAVTAVPLLHWTGSWKAYGQSLTLDLRAMGDGDAIGTVTDKGDSAQVIVVDGSRVFLKAGKAYWRHGDTKAADVARYAGRWVDEGSGVWGAALGDLSPRKLGSALKVSPVSDPWTPAPPTQTTTPLPTPSDVPSGAARFIPDDSQSLPAGTFWASASSPHTLVAYTGVGLPGEKEDYDPPVKQSTLSVRAGSVQDARAAYAELAAQARTLPKTMVIESGFSTDFNVDNVDLPSHCRSGNCHIKVTGHNQSDEHRSVQASVDVTVYGSRSMSGGSEKAVGDCVAKLPLAAPGKTVHGSCNVTDPRVDRFWNSVPGSFIKIAYWDEHHVISNISAQEAFDPTPLLTELTTRANNPPAGQPTPSHTP
ncbi:hypothetical protein [Actinoallomurus iriomotensis]|uniref:hypothetical protein n=1 Tax=Actinoallomurus iriomotensis TaxID=478107 RepID=UPI00255450C0|nr:hypothetical protein [Actinoallomurus iriomotensis]